MNDWPHPPLYSAYWRRSERLMIRRPTVQFGTVISYSVSGPTAPAPVKKVAYELVRHYPLGNETATMAAVITYAYGTPVAHWSALSSRLLRIRRVSSALADRLETF